MRIAFVSKLFLCLTMACCAGAALAQAYPARPIEFVVHTAPGGGTDSFARLVTDTLTRQKIVTAPLVVANRQGGSGVVAFTHVKGRRGDPYTVLTMATGSFMTAATRPDLELGLEHFTPIAFFASDPQAIMVAADSKFKTFKELLEAARREPDTLTAAVTSAGGTARILLWTMERTLGMRTKFVTFKSGGEAALAVLGGHVMFSPENPSEALALIESGKMRVLAVTSEKRLPLLPDVPTMLELGHKLTAGTGRGFVMPAGVPKGAAAFMEAALEKVHQSAAWRDYATKNNFENRWMGAAAFGKYLDGLRAEMGEFSKAMTVVK